MWKAPLRPGDKISLMKKLDLYRNFGNRIINRLCDSTNILFGKHYSTNELNMIYNLISDIKYRIEHEKNTPNVRFTD